MGSGRKERDEKKEKRGKEREGKKLERERKEREENREKKSERGERTEAHAVREVDVLEELRARGGWPASPRGAGRREQGHPVGGEGVVNSRCFHNSS